MNGQEPSCNEKWKNNKNSETKLTVVRLQALRQAKKRKAELRHYVQEIIMKSCHEWIEILETALKKTYQDGVVKFEKQIYLLDQNYKSQSWD